MVIINDSSCVNCGLCQRICPSGAICLINHSIDQRLCLECYHCVAVCQSNAITNGLLPPVEAVDFFPRRNELKNLILQRRSVRNYSSRKPETDLLQSFISDLRYSPTASNAQSLCFSIVTGQQVIERVNDLTIATFRTALKPFGNALLKPMLRLAMGHEAFERMNRYRLRFENPKNPRMVVYNAPAMIAVHAPDGKNSLAAMDASIWMGQAVLYAPSLGLASCINGFVVKAAKRNKQIASLMGVPDGHQLHAVLLIGYPATRFVNLVERREPLVAIVN